MVGCAAIRTMIQTPNPAPLDFEYCAEQHTETTGGHEVVVCDELFSEAPFVHLSRIHQHERAIAGLQSPAFITVAGETFGHQQEEHARGSEQDRHRDRALRADARGR